MYNEALLLGHLPPTLNSAVITLLLKKDKDPTLCSSFRSISLLNVDYKILAKVLALRLQHVFPGIITSDQTGFMFGRQSFHNTRRLLNILNMPSSTSPELVVTLNAEKAFDHVEWEFLFDVMNRFGLGESFISWVKCCTLPLLPRCKQMRYSHFLLWHKAGVSTVPFIVCHCH